MHTSSHISLKTSNAPRRLVELKGANRIRRRQFEFATDWTRLATLLRTRTRDPLKPEERSVL
jgi:hypothetical protein